nr:MAG TPA: hypothetical protein [Caudoviricetes sp.]
MCWLAQVNSNDPLGALPNRNVFPVSCNCRASFFHRRRSDCMRGVPGS